MITQSINTNYQPPADILTARSALTAETANGASPDSAAETASAPVARSHPRLRRSSGLENTSPASQTSSVPDVSGGGRLSTIQEQRESLGNTHNTQILAIALEEVRTALMQDPDADVAALVETKQFSPHRFSTFGREHQLKPGEQLSVAWYLRESLVYVPQNLEQLSNLIDVSLSQLHAEPPLGDYRGALNTLGSEQRTQLSNLATSELGSLFPDGSNMFKVFHDKHAASVQGKSAADRLGAMIESPEAQAFGKKLKAGFPETTPPASAVELALAAMIVALDPHAGSPHGVVAGYDLYQPANAGIRPSVVVERLVQHLVSQGKVPAEMAAAAAHLLLAGSAPAFLVSDMPENLVVGSSTWAKLQAAVEVDEYRAPGIAASNSFRAFMARADHVPVSDEQAIVQGKAQSHALIGWGIAQGKISRKDDDAYAQAEVAELRKAFNAQLVVLKTAQEQLSAILPTRKDMALAELKKAYGAQGPFDVRTISITNIDASESEDHSLLEIYMAGKMDRIPKGERFDFRLGDAYHRVKPLPDIKQQFDNQFDSYLRNLKQGVGTAVKHQLSQLPLADRQTIASGKVEFYSLRKASVAQAEGEETQEQAQAAKAPYGLLMRVESKIDKNGSDRDHKNLRYVYYEVFPLQGTIRRRDDLPRYLPNPAPRVSDPETYTERQAKGSSLWVDYDAYESGTAPQPEKYSGGLLNEKVGGVFLPEPREGQQASADVSLNPRFATLGRVIADHLLKDHQAMKAGARGVTHLETEEAGIKAGHDFVTGLIPFKNAIENAVKGNTGAAIRDFALDIFGFLMPFSKGVGTAVNQLSKGVGKLGARVFSASEAVTRGIFSGLNPVDGLGSVGLGLVKGGKTLLQKSYGELKRLLQAGNFDLTHVGKLSNTLDSTLFERYAVNNVKLEGLTPNSQGIYQAADQQFYIRHVRENGDATVLQVREVTHSQGVVQARVIDPKTNRQTEYLLQKSGADQWETLGLKGGVPDSTGTDSVTKKRPHSDSANDSPSSGQSAPKRPRIPESFPGEKADLEPPVKGKNVFYHYTGARNHAGINASRTLDPSSSDFTGQKLPRKQGRHYFTDLAPGDKPIKEISETIFGRRKYGNAEDKMTHYYEVNTSGLELKPVPGHPHIFYLDTAFSIPLKYRNGGAQLIDRVIKHGPVPT